jgi:hypothetical protein
MNGPAMKIENSTVVLASSPAARYLKFERPEWTSFRTVEGLQQKAGVARSMLRRLVLKELADNALDSGADTVSAIPFGDSYAIEDDGDGIPGTPQEIARLFSIARPMVSTKLLRLPTRGALGNGLRVVAGAVLASAGTLVVVTRNQRIELRPERDGSTTVVHASPVEFPQGTRIEIVLGQSLPRDAQALSWAETAIDMAQFGTTYAGKSSPWWYDAPQFHELLYASGTTPVRELVAELDGCSGGKAGEIVAAAGLGRMTCVGVTDQQAARLLKVAQENARQVSPKRLGSVGPELFDNCSHACCYNTIRLNGALIPVVVESWATVTKTSAGRLLVSVNRTPVAGNIHARRDKRDVDVFGCGLANNVASAPKDVQFDIVINITTPFMPITSDGKEPDLRPFLDEIGSAVQKAIRKAHRPTAQGATQKDVVLDHLDQVIADVSGDGKYRFNVRQVFYGMRPIVKGALDRELQLGNFTGIITDYESEHGEIQLMYREPRGTITHPHRAETISLGTLMVEEYERPAWTFNKLVYIEKEGAAEALKEVRWGERHDCAVLSSKGFSTRAARDLIDKLAEHDEPIEVFCVHDADASGSLIYQTLQEATRARAARKITITNLGLDPWEAIDMGLEVEQVERGERRKPTADYVRDGPGFEDWDGWLQTHRVELNAMTTPAFIEWLDLKMAEHGSGKLVPPEAVLVAEFDERIAAGVAEVVRDRILREANFDAQVAAGIAAIEKPDGAALAREVRLLFEREADRTWRDAIEAAATLGRR